jgi:hypothetical protein
MNREQYYFTFGSAHKHPNGYVIYEGDFFEARAQMFSDYGDKWAFQYSHDQWNEGGTSIADRYHLTLIED